MSAMKNNNGKNKWILSLLILGAALAVFSAGVRNVTDAAREKGGEHLEQVLRQAAVACYAAEGIYPPDVAYLQAHYGVQIDESRYAVAYEVFADNLMPGITVLERTVPSPR